MHWNNGKFHDCITVNNTVYITDHKHIAIHATKDSTEYGQTSINSYIYGKDVGVTANSKFFADSNSGSNLWSKQYVRIEAGSNSANHGSDSGSGIEIVSKNGNALFNADGYDVNITSTNKAVNINAGTYINLNAGTGITVNNKNYGSILPTTGNVEGRVYYKLIS